MFSAHRSQTAKNPVRCPKASFTQTNTPPVLGHPVASSAETMETGIKKRRAARAKKKREAKPYSAIVGQLRTLLTAATLIIASVKTLSVLGILLLDWVMKALSSLLRDYNRDKILIDLNLFIKLIFPKIVISYNFI